MAVFNPLKEKFNGWLFILGIVNGYDNGSPFSAASSQMPQGSHTRHPTRRGPAAATSAAMGSTGPAPASVDEEPWVS